MKKLLLFLLITTCSLSLIHAQSSYYTRQSGSWSDATSVWSTTSQTGSACSCNPGNSIAGSVNVYVYNNITSSNALSSLSGSGKLTIEAGDSATISSSSFSLSGSSSITVNGTLFIYAPITMAGSSSITISSTGSVFIYGNVSNSGSATVTDNGSLTVHGNVATSGSAAFSGSGKSYVIGTVTGPNTSMLSVLPDFFSSFSSASGNGLVAYQTSPSLSFQPLQYNGQVSSVLAGNGTWVSGSSFSPWTVAGNSIYYNGGNIGIGTSNPTYPLTLQGDMLANGTIYATSVQASNSFAVGTFKVVKGFVDSITSSTGTILLNSPTIIANNQLTAPNITVTQNLTANTIGSTSGSVNFNNNNIITNGTVTANNFNVNKLTIADTAKAPVIEAERIALYQGDSLIHFGDSSIIMNLTRNNIYSTGTPTCRICIPPLQYTGIALGYPNTVTGSSAFATTSIAMGVYNNLNNGGIAVGGSNTINGAGVSIGYTNTISSGGFMTIGAGLTNNLTGAIMIGNSISNKPAITIIPDPSGNTAGITQVEGSLSIYNSGNNNSLFFGQDQIPNTYNPQYGEWGIMYVPAATFNNNTGGLNFWKPSTSGNFGNAFLWLSDNGNIGIKTSVPQYLLDVAGTIHAFEILVCVPNNGCDFVFDKDYKLMSLDTLNAYLKQNHHLPEIASAKQMTDEGTIGLGKMNMKLLQKVEELTLYTIQQDQKEKHQQEEIEKQTNKINELEAKLDLILKQSQK